MKAAYEKQCEHTPTHIKKNFFSSGLYAVTEDTKIARNPERTSLFFIHSFFFFFFFLIMKNYLSVEMFDPIEYNS